MARSKKEIKKIVDKTATVLGFIGAGIVFSLFFYILIKIIILTLRAIF